MRAEQGHRLRLPPRMPSADGHGGGLDILVVEDDPDTAHSTALLLRCFGHQVRVAVDGPSACQAARSKPPDVVLLDLALPGMDGWEVARRLRGPAWDKKPFFMAVTGYGGEEDRRRSLEAGIDLHLEKPVDPDYLRRLLAKFHRILMLAMACSEAGGEGLGLMASDVPADPSS